jgi:WD40 repeat protein/serine/threonine protein kinase
MTTHAGAEPPQPFGNQPPRGVSQPPERGEGAPGAGDPRAAFDAVTLARAATTAGPIRAGGQFAEYDLLEEIARGGMGVVYKARHRRLGRLVALKMILAGQLASHEEVLRFQTEASAAARLDHPGIVPIHEVGCHDGQHFFSMGYIDGESLAQRIARGPLDPQEGARIVRQVASAMQFAHENSTIHRDLKPSNILLDSQDQPRITDFGLAKHVEAGSELTGSGQILGTPSYMPPEQAAGRADRAGPLADVYSLGAVLYAALAGRPPFQSANPIDTLLQVLNAEPVAPRQLNPKVPADLETICLKCLHKEPLRRYASARALADDLDRFLQGMPIEARPVSTIERAWRWHRRNRMLGWSIIIVAAVLAVASVVSTLFGIAAVRSRDLARQQANRALEQEQAAESNLRQAWRNYYAANMNLAQSSWEAGDVGRVVELLDPFARTQGALPDPRGWEWHYQKRLCESGRRTLSGVSGLVFAAAYDPQGFSLAMGTENAVTIWDPATGKMQVQLAPHADLVTAVCYSADGARFASASRDGSMQLHLGNQRKPWRRLERLGAAVRALTMDQAGQLLAAATTDGRLIVWDVDAGATRELRTNVEGALRAVALSADGDVLASAGTTGVIAVRSTNSLELLRQFQASEQPIECLCFAGRRRICTAGQDGAIRLWEADLGQLAGVLYGHLQGIHALSIASAAPVAATGGADGTVRVWNLQEQRPLRTLRGHGNPVRCVAIDARAARLASSGLDARIRLWDLAADEELRILAGHRAPVTSLAFEAEGEELISAGADGQILVWNVPSAERRILLAEPGVPVLGLARAADGRVLLAAAEDGTVRLGAPAANAAWRRLSGHEGRVSCVAASPQGGHAVSGGWDATVRVWDLEAGAERRVLRGHESYVHAVAIDRTGKVIASAGQDASVRLWNSSGEVASHVLRDHESYVLSLAFDPLGEFLAAGCWNGDVVLWEVAQPERFRTFRGHRDRVHALAISPDGRRLVSAGADQTLRIWDRASGQELMKMAPAAGTIYSVAIDPTLRRIAAGCADGRIMVWDASPPAASAEAANDNVPEAAISREAMSRLSQGRYEFGWAAGESNGHDELLVSFHDVTSIEHRNEELIVRYNWKEGVLRATLSGQTLRGQWRQQNGRGDVFLRFDPAFTRATGWWNEGAGSLRHAAFLRERRGEP